MSDEFNIRDFRNAGAANESLESEKSNRTFYTCVIAIPVIAAVAGLGYKPIMDFRNKNVAAVQQAEVNMEAKRRAENPLYALKQDMRNSDGLIDSSKIFNSGAAPSPQAKLRKEYARKSMNANEFLNRLDAKASNFSPLEMETLKYERATWALSTCNRGDLRAFYIRQNKPAYDILKAKRDAAEDARRDARMAKVDKLDIPKIENKTQAIAFVASGGARRHQENAMEMMSGIGGLLGDSGKYKIKQRRQRFNPRGCSQVSTIVQSGAMRIKPNVRLK